MKPRFIAALLLAIFQTGTLSAEEATFYQKETDNFWTVFGSADNETGQVTCYGRANKKDGSFIQIHRSLVNGELWAIVHGTEWEIKGSDQGSLRWNFYSGAKNGLIAGANFDYVLRDKNTLLILQIEPNKFSEALWNSKYFTLVMPGDVPNFSVSFETKGGTMLTGLAECIKQNAAKYKNYEPSLEKVPDAVKEQL